MTDDSSKRVTRETLADALMRVAGHLPGPDGQPDEPMAQRIFDALPVTPTPDPEADADLEQAWARLQRDYYSVGGEARRTGMEVAVHRRRIEAALPATPAASETADAARERLIEETAHTLLSNHKYRASIDVARELVGEYRPLIEAALSRSTPTPPESVVETLSRPGNRANLDDPRLAVDSLNSTVATPTPDATDAARRRCPACDGYVAGDRDQSMHDRIHGWSPSLVPATDEDALLRWYGHPPRATPDATDAGSREALEEATEGPQRVDEPYHEWHQRNGVEVDDTCYDCTPAARLGKRP